MSTQTKQHNESRADLNSDGPTIDAEVSVSKEDALEKLDSLAGKLEVAGLVIGIAASLIKIARKRQS